MAAEKKANKRIYRKLRNKFRLVVMNDETFEEKISIRLSPLNVFVSIGSVLISLITLIIYIIAFTPLREYIPGYADVSMKRRLISLSLKADSLASQVQTQETYMHNLAGVMEGKAGKDTTTTQPSSVRYDTLHESGISEEDSILRTRIESRDRFDLAISPPKAFSSSISSFYFFTPVKGTVTSAFDPRQKHFGVDVVATPDEAIKATLDGTVILADWTSDAGYVIGVQHSNNLFSIYKHNSALLKSPGSFVKAGEVIAFIGNTGEFTSGPHLHFELWYNGNPVNPEDYMPF
jgi:murein DD-endopeptidase MepM/ murein hydrolase activator NlpD